MLPALLLIATLSAVTLGVLAQPPGRDAGGRGRPFEPPRVPVMMALDTNGDGELSGEEISAATEALKKLDKSGDGILSRDELRPEFGGPGRPEASGPGRPEGPRGGGPGGRGPGGPGPLPGEQTSGFRSETLPVDDVERNILQALKQITEEQGRRMNVPDADGRLLRCWPKRSTRRASSSSARPTASRRSGIASPSARPAASSYSRDRSGYRRRGSQELPDRGSRGIVTVVEGDAHERAKVKGPIDLVFIDADKEGYLDYFQKLLPLVRPGGLISPTT